jgi:hypothetical protein
VSDEPSTCEAGGKKKRKEREKLENNPCTLTTREKEKTQA